MVAVVSSAAKIIWLKVVLSNAMLYGMCSFSHHSQIPVLLFMVSSGDQLVS